jgi:hypothetical protein
MQFTKHHGSIMELPWLVIYMNSYQILCLVHESTEALPELTELARQVFLDCKAADKG